jgi:alpha-beta hydrolase superfamily lysophospholipase
MNIVHGVMEHSGRYRESARLLCAAGIEVWCADQRGHGLTAEGGNAEQEGGLFGHIADKKGALKALRDIDMTHKTIKSALQKEGRNVPLILFGHSWGSFLVQAYLEFYGDSVSLAVLSGSKGPGGTNLTLNAALLAVFDAFFGARARSPFIYRLAFGPYQKAFAPCRTSADWLSRDESAVDSYLADPLCAIVPTIGLFRDLTALLRQIHRTRAIERIRKKLPFYIFGGSADPVSGGGRTLTALVKKYRAAGIEKIDFVLYPGARHECLNEINREEVMRNLIKWLEKHL